MQLEDGPRQKKVLLEHQQDSNLHSAQISCLYTLSKWTQISSLLPQPHGHGILGIIASVCVITRTPGIFNTSRRAFLQVDQPRYCTRNPLSMNSESFR